jgi:hypothetical protein
VGKLQVQIVPATKEHAVAMAPRMRAPEVAEVRASGGYGPLEALLESLGHSELAYAALLGGEVACMWGVEHVRYSALYGRVGAAWMLTTPLVERYPVTFYRGCRVELQRLFETFGMLINAIDLRHEQAVRWATRLGFPMEPPVLFGAEQRAFMWFRVRREDLNV